MTCLPEHGRVECAICHRGQPYGFDRTVTSDNQWRITNNPLAWGNPSAEIVVLGFSKGPTQAGALSTQKHDAIAYKGGRTNLAKILHHVGLIDKPDGQIVDRLIGDKNGRFHFASLVRCTVERFDTGKKLWTGTNGGMLDKFVATSFGNDVVTQCATRHLADLPANTRLVIMLGMGTGGKYMRSCRKLYRAVRPGNWRDVNAVTYTDGTITVVHTEHFQSQGALIPNWLSGNRHKRGLLGDLARTGVATAFEGV